MSRDKKQQATVPRLRFAEFRKSPGWREVVVQEVADVIAGQSPRGENYNDLGHGIPFYQGKTDFGDIFIEPPTKWTTQVTKLASGGDILMSVRAPVGALNISTQNICIGRGLAALQAKEHKWFLYYLLSRSNHLFVGNGGSVFDSISKSQIESTQIFFPTTYAEQKKIADCLKSLDDLIVLEGRKLTRLRDHKKGLMQQLFPREGETRPRLRFPEFQDAPDWKVIPLAELLVRDPEYGVNAASVPYSEDLPAYVRITDIDDDGRYLPEGRVSVDIEASDDDFLKDGDLVLARTGASVGKSYRYRPEDGGLVFAGFLLRVRPKPTKLDSRFLAAFLSTGRYWDWVRITSTRSGQPGINGSEYASMPFPIPPDEDSTGEQEIIADCLVSLDDLIAAQAAKLNALRTHKRGLMQQLFPTQGEDQ